MNLKPNNQDHLQALLDITNARTKEWYLKSKPELLSKQKQCHLHMRKRPHGCWAIIALILSGWLVWV